MKISNLTLLLWGLVLVAGYGCKKTAIEQSKIDYEKYNNYISGYSQSPISRCDDLFINLGFQLPAGALPSDLIRVNPEIGGRYKVGNGRKRIILTDADIKHNVKYTVHFNIGKLKEMPKGMETFTFPLEAKRQNWDILMEPPINASMDYVSYKVKYYLES